MKSPLIPSLVFRDSGEKKLFRLWKEMGDSETTRTSSSSYVSHPWTSTAILLKKIFWRWRRRWWWCAFLLPSCSNFKFGHFSHWLHNWIIFFSRSHCLLFFLQKKLFIFILFFLNRFHLTFVMSLFTDHFNSFIHSFSSKVRLSL